MTSIFLLAMPGFWPFLLILPIYFFPVIFWLWAIWDVIKRDFVDEVTKKHWLLLVILIPVLGAILYHQRGPVLGK
jgi:hypothetical protein